METKDVVKLISNMLTPGADLNEFGGLDYLIHWGPGDDMDSELNVQIDDENGNYIADFHIKITKHEEVIPSHE